MSLLELAFENNEDSLSVRHFAVREPISGLFDVSILARSRLVGLDIESFVGRPAAFIMMGGPLATPRAWSGIATHFQMVQAEPTGLSTYFVRIAPQMYLLRLRKRNRIFQHLTIPQMIQKILQEYSIVHKMQTVDVHQEHEYRVQYEESDFDFVNRLCEEEGISYYFNQVAVGTDYTTEMILMDKPESREDRPALPFVYAPNQDARQEFVRHVKIAHRIRPGASTFRDYDHVRPDFQLIGDAEKAKKPEDFYELYKYDPAALVKDRRGKPRVPAEFEGELVSQIDLAAARRDKRRLSFDSNAYDLGPGVLFQVKDHPRSDITGGNIRFLCTDVSIEGTHDGEWNLSGVAAFVEEKAKTRFRPIKNTPKPVIEGVESAIVVGLKGEEIHTDEYGRVRVQFHWDRDGQYDEKSSCFVRVNQGWAGGAFGMIVLPRIGQEVLIGFLEGDPDQPILVGRAYNKVAPVPFVLPDQMTVSTWKSQSSPKADGWNEITFDDAAGKELVYVQAQRNLSKLVKANENERTGVNRTIFVGANRSSFIGAVDSYVIGKRHVAAVMPPKEIDVTKDGDPEIPPMKTMMETVHPKITFTTSKATSIIDNKDIVLLADRNVVFKSGGDVIVEGKHVYINTKGVSGKAPKVEAGASDGARKIAGRTLGAVREVFGQPKAQAIRLAMQRQLIGFRPPAPREVRIAGLPGSTVEQMNARRKVALEFYKTMGRVWDGDLKALREYVLPDELRAILDHITGIDFRQPLKVGPPPPMPAKQSQWQVPNGPKGQYFAAAGTNPVNLGIGPVGQLKKDTPIEKKISTDYAIPMGTPYLQSIASAKTDTWSIKSGTNRNQPTKGGAIQYYVGDTAPINAIGPTPDASR
jgi:type VI secretion system secreted protein VgrG